MLRVLFVELPQGSETAAENPEASVFFGAGRIVYPTGKVGYYKNPPAEIDMESLYNWMSGGNFMQPSCLFRRDAWEKAGPNCQPRRRKRV